MAGYSSTPLSKKLGLKEGQRVRFIHQPEKLLDWLGIIPDFKIVTRHPYDVIVLFVNEIQLLEDWLVKLRHQISQDGMIWVAWYKKAAKKPTEITEDIIRETALPFDLVDVKVCAISEDWSGLKLVIRLTARKSLRK